MRVVGVVNPALSSDCTITVRVGVDVPATDSTCSAAYIDFPATTAPNWRPVPVDELERDAEPGWISEPRTMPPVELPDSAAIARSPTGDMDGV